MTDRPSPYEAPELYDLMFETLDFDLPYWLKVGREAGGPVLDLGCGTGRILLPLLEAGVDADGVDLHRPMLAYARRKAEATGPASSPRT
jgi:SAM-dependent methyltransferase